MPPRTEHRTHALRVVAGDRAEEIGADHFERSFDAPSPTARPSDRCEPWPVDDEPRLQSLAATAAELRISLELAAVVVIERSLLAGDLAAYGPDELARRLDAEAVRARVEIELSEPLSAYLAALSGHARAATRSLPRSLALPMRLTERIVAREGRPQLDATLLVSALRWERAAVLKGRTMSEWAVLKALRLGR